MTEAIKSLITLSNLVGGQINLVQGGGGNISIKDGSIMYIKASGTPLKAMSEKKGWVAIDSQGAMLVAHGEQRPSMEWPMHLLLPRVVIHCHSVYANLWLCRNGGMLVLSKQLSAYQPMLIPYTTPGTDLAKAIQQQLTASLPRILLLENHGLIICGETVNETLGLLSEINTLLMTTVDQPFTVTPEPKTLPPLFPDAAVFTNHTKLTIGVLEILSANQYIHETIIQSGGLPKPLSATESDRLRTMEQEQYRQQVI